MASILITAGACGPRLRFYLTFSMAQTAASFLRQGVSGVTKPNVTKARVTVTLKNGVLDPQGKAIEGALASLGVAGVAGVRQGKVFDIDLSERDGERAKALLGEACEKLLANTVIENYRIELVEA